MNEIWRRAGLAAFAAFALAAPAAAQDVRVAVAAMGEVSALPEAAGHGAVLVGVDIAGRDALRGTILYDTETLRLGVDGIRLGERFHLGFDAAGEFAYASLLPDYHIDGRLVPERGFAASHAGGGATLTWSPGRKHFVRARAGGRYWVFGELPDTAAAFVLPEDRAVGEFSIDYTLWSVHEGSDFSERQRAFPRLRGVALHVGVNGWVNSTHAAWGARDATVFDPVDRRNDPARAAVRPYLHLRAGTAMHPRLRWQVDHRAGHGGGEDDITRTRIGGMNRYVVPIGGMPWGAVVSEKFASGEWSWHGAVGEDHELGFAAAGVFVTDPQRTGDSPSEMLFGLTAFADLRFGGWQVDARVGLSPTVPGDELGVSALLGVGWGNEE